MSPTKSPTVAYLGPAWGLVPTKEQSGKSHRVHVLVIFADDTPSPVPITHNLDLPYGAPLSENEWVTPYCVVNLLSGGPAAPLHTIEAKDGNNLAFGRVASGEGPVPRGKIKAHRMTLEGRDFVVGALGEPGSLGVKVEGIHFGLREVPREVPCRLSGEGPDFKDALGLDDFPHAQQEKGFE